MKTQTADREMVISRLIDAPRELVWEAWTNPEHVKHWWGPDGFTNTIHIMEVKPGGEWNFIMHGPNNMNFPNKIIFREVVKPERLVYTHGSDDPNDKASFETTVTFELRGNKTFHTMKALFSTAEEKEKMVRDFGVIEGGNQSLSRLDLYMTSGRLN